MKLFDMTGAPNPRRVRVFLAEKGIDIEKIQIDIMSGENLRDEYLRLTRAAFYRLCNSTMVPSSMKPAPSVVISRKPTPNHRCMVPMQNQRLK